MMPNIHFLNEKIKNIQKGGWPTCTYKHVGIYKKILQTSAYTFYFINLNGCLKTHFSQALARVSMTQNSCLL